MMDVTIPMIHTTGVNSPVVVISVKIVSFMTTPSFPSHPAGLAMVHRRFPSRPRTCHRIFRPFAFCIPLTMPKFKSRHNLQPALNIFNVNNRLSVSVGLMGIFRCLRHRGESVKDINSVLPRKAGIRLNLYKSHN